MGAQSRSGPGGQVVGRRVVWRSGESSDQVLADGTSAPPHRAPTRTPAGRHQGIRSQVSRACGDPRCQAESGAGSRQEDQDQPGMSKWRMVSTFQETRRRFTKLDSWVVMPTGSQARGAIDATELFGSLPPGLLFACSHTLTCCTVLTPHTLTCSPSACLND
jgi:hypothetical protein